MSSLRTWFTTELEQLGFSGLEAVFDYVATLPDTEIREYLQNLLGTEPRVFAFATAYIQARRTGNIPSRSSADDVETTAQHPHPTMSTWAAVGTNGNAPASKKGKRRGKNRKGNGNGNWTDGKTEEKASFAKAVLEQGSSSTNSAQSNAIRNAPAEQVRQRIREYRKTRKPINCIRCGHIELVVREDGACSFCHEPIFSMYDRTERSSAQHQLSQSSSPHRRQRKRSMPLVLGRYVFPPGSTEDSSDGGRLVKDIAGSIVLDPRICAEEEGDVTEKASGCPNQPTEGYYNNPSISKQYLEERCAIMAESVRDLVAKVERDANGRSNQGAYGRLQVDDISPNACMYSS